MKKLLAILLCLMMVITLFAGCNNNASTDETNGGEVVNGDQVVLEIGVLGNANVISFTDNAYTKWLEEQTGYKLKFYEFPATSADAKSVLSTMVVDGELPDILWNISLADAVISDYGEDGYFIDLKPYYDDKEGASKIFWERFALLSEDEQEANLRRITDPESGAMYSVPRIEQSLIDPMKYQAWINKAWLDELNLEAPTDPESLYNVLKAFKDAKGDSIIPMMGLEGGLGANLTNWIINMYTYCNNDRVFNVGTDGKLYLPQTTDVYREALIYINKLVKEGLLSPMTWTVTAAEMKSITAQSPSMVGVFVGHLTLHVTQEAETLYDYVPLNCYGNAILTENLNSRATYITADCDYPDEAFNLLMTMTSKEGSMRMRYGEYGTNWTDADAGTKSFLGLDAEIKILKDPWATQQQATWGSINSTILINAEGEVNQIDETTMTQWQLYKNKIVAEQMTNFYAVNEANDKSMVCPVLVYTEEEDDYIRQIRSDCSGILTKYRSEFCNGVQDPNDDAAWDAYKKQLETLGVEEWIKLAQSVYDRQQSDS